MRRELSTWAVAILACTALLSGRALAQPMDTDGPRWLRLDVPTERIGVEVEALREDAKINGSRSTHEYLSVTPLAGVATHGSIYHPDLINFDLSAEGGLGYAWDSISSIGYDLHRDERRELVRYLVQVNLLSAKAYNANFFASQDHTYQNYDFFNTATVDSFRYGGHAGWTTPKFSINANAGYRSERSSTLTGITDFSDTYADLTAIHNREFGTTTLTFGHDEYRNTLNDGPSLSSLNNYVGASDSETFGSRKQFTATAGLNYSEYAYFDQHTDTLNANGGITAKHTETLDSFGTLNYTRSSLETVTSSVFQGVAGVRHHLFESLTSSADVHGTYDETTSGAGDAFSDRYGVGIREDYTKRLGSESRLSIGLGAVVDHEDYGSPTPILTVIDEVHTLQAPGSQNFRPAYLNNPRVIASTIQVRAGNVPAREGFDYQVIPSGQLTEIRMVRGSIVITDGSQVLVSYQAASIFDASFESVSLFASIRFDLYNMFGVYGRFSWLGNNAPTEFLTETYTDIVGGVDWRWKWFRAGAEYEDFDSNFTKYQALRFFENFSYQLAESSTVGAEFNQVFYRYPDDRNDTQFQFIGRFTTQLTTWLWWNVEAGYFMQDFFGVEQNLAAARTDVSFNRGKLSIKAGYQYNYQLITQSRSEEERNRNFGYISLRRYF